MRHWSWFCQLTFRKTILSLICLHAKLDNICDLDSKISEKQLEFNLLSIEMTCKSNWRRKTH